VKGKQCETLRRYAATYWAAGAADLATVFLHRCYSLTMPGGTYATVSPQNWLYLRSYSKFRKLLLASQSLNHISRVGSGSTSTASWDVLRALAIATRITSESHAVTGIDLTEPSEEARASGLRTAEIRHAPQPSMVEGVEAIIAFGAASEGHLLGDYALALQGISTGDSFRLVRLFWEIPHLVDRWRCFQVQPQVTAAFAGREHIVDWQTLEAGFEGAALRGQDAWRRQGIAVAQMRELPATLYGGTLFSNSTPVIVPKRPEYLPALWAFCSSQCFNEEVRRINAKMSVDNGYLRHVRFDCDAWQLEASRRYPKGLPSPNSMDPTQWLFSGFPAPESRPLHVAVARLVGYLWPRQQEPGLDECGTTGVDELRRHADGDGLVCLTPLRGEASAAERLRALLADAFGSEWSAAKQGELLAAVGFDGRSLDDWLREGFFEQHCALFHQRPFVWHVWDGLKNGFGALVNYHRLAAPGGEGRRTLEKLVFTYLRDWIDRQRADQKADVEGADGRVAAAEHLKRELERILAGESPYDLFVRWKPLHEQPIGWEPDVNDGVRLNVRPFVQAKPLGARGKNACILRVTPKIGWDKDRGKEPARPQQDFPWFWGWDGRAVDFASGKEFDGNRWNDLHYTRGVKLAARERAKGGTGG